MKLIAKIAIFFMLLTPILVLASNYIEDHVAKSAPLSVVLHSDDGVHHHGDDGIDHHHDNNDDHDHDGLCLHHTSVTVYALPMSHHTNTLNGSSSHTHFFTPLYKNKVLDFPERPPIA